MSVTHVMVSFVRVGKKLNATGHPLLFSVKKNKFSRKMSHGLNVSIPRRATWNFLYNMSSFSLRFHE
jgi:hypothetical protein